MFIIELYKRKTNHKINYLYYGKIFVLYKYNHSSAGFIEQTKCLGNIKFWRMRLVDIIARKII